MRLWLMEGSSSVCSGESRRKPLQLLTGFFGRKSRREDPGREQGSRETGGWLSHDGGDEEDSDGDLLHIPEPMEALHSPYHARTIHEDMENLRLSRQDNPFLLELEVLESRESLYESSDSLYEEKQLMSKENVSRNAPTLSEVHARLVRSPPPVMWTRSRNSEPSFIHLMQGSTGHGDSMFQFPPSRDLQLPTNGHSHSHSQSDKVKLHPSSSPGQYSDSHLHGGAKHGRFMESAVEALSARFNLSPQPRRRPKDDHLLATFMD